MRVLFLDDDERRCHFFSQICLEIGGVSVDFAKDAASAIEKLLEHQYDFISLDHDLHPSHYECYRKEAMGEENVDYGLTMTGESVVDAMDGFGVSVGKAIVHSYNNFGAERMINTLTKLGWESLYIPFGSEQYCKQIKQWSKV